MITLEKAEKTYGWTLPIYHQLYWCRQSSSQPGSAPHKRLADICAAGHALVRRFKIPQVLAHEQDSLEKRSGESGNGEYKCWECVDKQQEHTSFVSCELQYIHEQYIPFSLRDPITMSRSPERISSYRRHFEDSSSSSYQVRVSSPSPNRRDARHASTGYSCGAGAGASSMRVASVGRRSASATRRSRTVGAG